MDSPAPFSSGVGSPCGIDPCPRWALDEAGTYYYSWETRGDAGVGTSLIDSDQMGVPTRCCAATEIAARRLAAFLRNTLCTSWQETEDIRVPYEGNLESSV